MTVRVIVASLAILSLLSSHSIAADVLNPVAMFGADGISLTPDDPLMVRGGYTNTIVTVCGAIESPTGDSNAPGSAYDHDVRLVSWNPDDGSVATIELFDGSNKWVLDPDAGKKTEMNANGNEDVEIFHVWQPPNPYTKPMNQNPDEDISFWNEGNNVLVSSLHFQSWEGSGQETESNPAIKICPNHLKGPGSMFLKDIRVIKCRTDAMVLSALNLEDLSSGIAGRVFCRLVDAGVLPKNPMPGIVELVPPGWVTGSSDVDVYLNILGMRMFLFKAWHKNKALSLVEKAWDKAGKEAPQNVLDYTGRLWDAGNGQDGTFTGAFWAFLPSNEWSVWKNTDAFNLRDNPQIDIKVDVLQDPVGADDIMPSSNYPINGGLSHQNSELLIYGRAKDIPLARLIEHFAASWLNLNLHLLNPYTGLPPKNSKLRFAEWRYYDLITDRNLTPAKGIRVPWPPAGIWAGGRGKVMGVQGACGLVDNTCRGKDRQPCELPGNPQTVLSQLVALCPDAQEPSGERILAYNMFGIQLDGSDDPPLEANWVDDPIGEREWYVPWPPRNETDTAIKAFYANVANGGDMNVVSDGAFLSGWDFDCDGEGETRFANTTYNMESLNRPERAILYVYNPQSGRCGAHRIDVPGAFGDSGWVSNGNPNQGGATTNTGGSSTDDGDSIINDFQNNLNNQNLNGNDNSEDSINPDDIMDGFSGSDTDGGG